MDYRVQHAEIHLVDLDLPNERIKGLVRLTVVPSKVINVLRLHAGWERANVVDSSGWVIHRVAVDGTNLDSADYELGAYDQSAPDFDESVPMLIERFQKNVKSSDLGSLQISLPESTFQLQPDQPEVAGASEPEAPPRYQPFILEVAYTIQRPDTGMSFFHTDDPNEELMWVPFAPNNARNWFPCVDLIHEAFSVDLHISVPHGLVAVAAGDFQSQRTDVQETTSVFHYSASTPVPASAVTFAVGRFQIVPDTHSPRITHFCLPGREHLVGATTEQVHQMLVCYEEYLCVSYPHEQHKIVFLPHRPGLQLNVCAGAGISLLSESLLHGPELIDQTIETRSALVTSLAFSWVLSAVTIKSWKDFWILAAASGFLREMYLRAVLGQNCHLERIHKMRSWVRQNDFQMIPLTCDKCIHPVELLYPGLFHKSCLVFSMLERRAGLEHFQNFMQLLFSARKHDNMNTKSLIKMLKKELGSETQGNTLKTFFDLWVYGGGGPTFRVGFTFNKDNFLIDIAVEQVSNLWAPPFDKLEQQPALKIRVHEKAGEYDHNVKILVQTLPSSQQPKKAIPLTHVRCHSLKKSHRRQRMEKSGLREKIDEGEPPIFWLRVDPEMEWICEVDFVQPLRMWVEQLHKDKDVMAQVEAVRNIWHLQSDAVIPVLVDTLQNETLFYGVRTEAAISLGKIPTDTSDSQGLDQLIRYFKKNFYSPQTGKPKPNDFEDLVAYHIKKALVHAIGLACDTKGWSPQAAVMFLFEVLEHNDNTENQYDDCNYMVVLIRAIGNLSPESQKDASEMLNQIQCHLRKDALLPSYQRIVSAECLEAMCDAMLNGFALPNPQLFVEHTRSTTPLLQNAAWRSLLRLCHCHPDTVYLLFDSALKQSPPDGQLLTWLASVTADAQFMIGFKNADAAQGSKRMRRLWDFICSSSSPAIKLAGIALFRRLLEIPPELDYLDSRMSFQSKAAPAKSITVGAIPKIVIKNPAKKRPLPSTTAPEAVAPPAVISKKPKQEPRRSTSPAPTVSVPPIAQRPALTRPMLKARGARLIVLKKEGMQWGVALNEYTPETDRVPAAVLPPVRVTLPAAPKKNITLNVPGAIPEEPKPQLSKKPETKIHKTKEKRTVKYKIWVKANGDRKKTKHRAYRE